MTHLVLASLVGLVLAGCGGASVVQPQDLGTTPSADLAQSSDVVQPSDLAVPQDLAHPDAAMPVDSEDGYAAARTACIDEMNRLRATQGLPPYTVVSSPTINACVDAQATSDEKSSSPHAAWIAAEGSSCDGNGQDECEGYGTDAAGIVACLDAMWNEKDQANCAGCVGCDQPGGNCPGCDFFGSNGQECGHYVNMSATYFTQVACGFSSAGGWAAQNFY